MTNMFTGEIIKGSLSLISNTGYKTQITNLLVTEFKDFVSALRSESNSLFTTQESDDTIILYRDDTCIAVVDKLLKNTLIDFINTNHALLGAK